MPINVSGFCLQVALSDIENAAVLPLSLESSGVGLFDAFFASLSMILVSEVSFTEPSSAHNIAQFQLMLVLPRIILIDLI